MPTVAVNPPKTPVTQGSHGVAAATVPNVCKMPGPPAPFIPTPLPNIGKSDNSPSGYSTSVNVEGNPVAIQGATFNSMGDVASQGTGGGLVSMNVQGATAFVAPGSLDVKIEGKNVQLLGDAMSNNNGPSGSPPNAATTPGEIQAPEPVISLEDELQEIANQCEDEVEAKESSKGKSCAQRGTEKHDCCDRKLADKANENPRSVYSDGAFDKNTGQMIPKKNPVKGGVPAQVPRTRSAFVNQAIGFASSQGIPPGPVIQGMLSGKQFPDVVVAADPTQPIGKGNVAAVYDFKFPCPKGKQAKWGQGGKQGDNYTKMLSSQSPAQIISPV